MLWCNGTNIQFYQGRLDVLQDGIPRFPGLVFGNAAHLVDNNVHIVANNAHLSRVRIVCIDGTYQVRPNHPEGIAQLVTIQIIINNVVRYDYFLINIYIL